MSIALFQEAVFAFGIGMHDAYLAVQSPTHAQSALACT